MVWFPSISYLRSVILMLFRSIISHIGRPPAEGFHGIVKMAYHLHSISLNVSLAFKFGWEARGNKLLGLHPITNYWFNSSVISCNKYVNDRQGNYCINCTTIPHSWPGLCLNHLKLLVSFFRGRKTFISLSRSLMCYCSCALLNQPWKKPWCLFL